MMNFFNLTLSEKHFIFPSILNESFAGYSNLGCRSLRLILGNVIMMCLRLGNLQGTLKRSNIRIIGVPEGEEEEQKIENLFEQIMENFPDLAKEIDFQEVQEAQRVPKKLDSREHTPRHIIIKLPKVIFLAFRSEEMASRWLVL